MQTIKAQSCSQGAAYTQAPPGSSQEENPPSELDLCLSDGARADLRAVHLAVEMFILKSSSTHCVCLRVCVIRTSNIQHMQWRNMKVRSEIKTHTELN